MTDKTYAEKELEYNIKVTSMHIRDLLVQTQEDLGVMLMGDRTPGTGETEAKVNVLQRVVGLSHQLDALKRALEMVKYG